MKNLRMALAVAAMAVSVQAKDFSMDPDQVRGVGKIAIVSLYANAEPRPLDEGAGGLAATAGFLKKKMKQKDGDATGGVLPGAALMDAALASWAAELGKIKGWSVADPASVIAAPAFKAFVDEYRAAVGPKAVEMMAAHRAVPAGMTPYLFVGKKDEAAKAERLKALCEALGVDGVAVIELDLGYRTKVSAGVAGAARPSVGSSLRVVTKGGAWAVRQLPAAAHVGRGPGGRGEPEGTVSTQLDKIPNNDAARALFDEAVRVGAADNTAYINARL